MNELSPEEIVSILQTEYESSESYRDSQLADEQAAAIDYYEGRPFGDEMEGRSQIVLPDVAEAIDYMTIAVLRGFVSGDKVVEFDATDPDYEDGAEDQTEAIDYIFMNQQDGYKILFDWLHSGLLERYGVVKTACVTEERVSRETFVVDPEMFALLESGEHPAMQENEAELENSTDNPDGTINAVIKYKTTKKRYIDIPVPSEEFRFTDRPVHEDDADYLAHTPLKTRSELVEMGYDRDQVYDLSAYEADIIDERQYSRDRDDYWSNEESSDALQQVLYMEEYARIDIDGDGIAERVKVCRVGDEILKQSGYAAYANGGLAIETIDEQPFVLFTPFPRAHRMIGNSLADKAMPLQRIRSVVARQLQDGLYTSNMPRPLVDTQNMDDNTIDDLLRPIPGSPIRYKGQKPEPYQTSFDVGKSLSVLEFWTGEGESRTGITQLNRGLNVEALNTGTATEFSGLQEQGQQYEEFIARNFANALGRLFAKKARLIKREGDKMNIKVDGKFREVDPTTWPDESSMRIKVGLGSGSKEKRVQARMAVAQLMSEGTQIGDVTGEHRFNMVDGLVRDMGLGKGEEYWTKPPEPKIDPETGEPIEQPEAPDPEQQAMEAEQQKEAAKLQMEQQKSAAMLQLKQQENAANIELSREKHMMDMEQKREAAALDAQLARERQTMEIALARDTKAAEIALARENAILDASVKADLPDNRPGGDLSK